MADLPVLDAQDLSIVGCLVTRAGVFPRGEVRVRDGKIVARLTEVSNAAYSERIDVGEAFVLPGIIDPHVHSLSAPTEGVEAATRSAAAGGVTTIMEMPFDQEAPVWTVDRLKAKRQLVAREAHVDVALYATVRPGGGVGEVAPLAAAGATCFKVSTYHTDPNRFPRTPDDELLEVFAAVAATGRRICVHAEIDEIVKAKIAENRSSGADPLAHCRSRPPVTETAAVAHVLELARPSGVKIHLCHMSLPRSFALIRAYAAAGMPASGEVCPHYLTFAEADMSAYGARLKVNPPVRSRADVEGLWARLRAGQVDAIASDHAPWPLAQKNEPNIFDNASGAPGVETLLPVVASEALARGVDIRMVAAVTSWRPAELFGLDHRKGDLVPGLDADLVIYDPRASYVLQEGQLHSNAGWSPFNGMRLSGRVILTVSRGAVVWDGKSVVSDPGRGQLITYCSPVAR